jgi:hypothetical protein
VLALVASACGSPAGRPAATATTRVPRTRPRSTIVTRGPTEAEVERGVALTLEPDDNATPVAPPAGLLGCVAKRLDPADRAAASILASADAVPANLAVRTTRAGMACNQAYVVASFTSQLTSGDGAIPGIDAAQATCGASRDS